MYWKNLFYSNDYWRFNLAVRIRSLHFLGSSFTNRRHNLLTHFKPGAKFLYKFEDFPSPPAPEPEAGSSAPPLAVDDELPPPPRSSTKYRPLS